MGLFSRLFGKGGAEPSFRGQAEKHISGLYNDYNGAGYRYDHWPVVSRVFTRSLYTLEKMSDREMREYRRDDPDIRDAEGFAFALLMSTAVKYFEPLKGEEGPAYTFYLKLNRKACERGCFGEQKKEANEKNALYLLMNDRSLPLYTVD